MPTQKELDLEVADRLEDFVTKLSEKHDLYCFLKGTALNEVNETEYLNIVSALRYAIASLRSNNNGR